VHNRSSRLTLAANIAKPSWTQTLCERIGRVLVLSVETPLKEVFRFLRKIFDLFVTRADTIRGVRLGEATNVKDVVVARDNEYEASANMSDYSQE
jgi:hypothetical protein